MSCYKIKCIRIKNMMMMLMMMMMKTTKTMMTTMMIMMMMMTITTTMMMMRMKMMMIIVMMMTMTMRTTMMMIMLLLFSHGCTFNPSLAQNNIASKILSITAICCIKLLTSKINSTNSQPVLNLTRLLLQEQSGQSIL